MADKKKKYYRANSSQTIRHKREVQKQVRQSNKTPALYKQLIALEPEDFRKLTREELYDYNKMLLRTFKQRFTRETNKMLKRELPLPSFYVKKGTQELKDWSDYDFTDLGNPNNIGQQRSLFTRLTTVLTLKSTETKNWEKTLNYFNERIMDKMGISDHKLTASETIEFWKIYNEALSNSIKGQEGVIIPKASRYIDLYINSQGGSTEIQRILNYIQTQKKGQMSHADIIKELESRLEMLYNHIDPFTDTVLSTDEIIEKTSDDVDEPSLNITGRNSQRK